MEYQLEKFTKLIESANKIVIIQGGNPDGDSLGSATALESLLAKLGKDTYLYCPIDIPDNIKYISGWDRVSTHLPSQYDLSIMVDCSYKDLIQPLMQGHNYVTFSQKPLIIIDHHEADTDIDFCTLRIYDPKAVSATQVVFNIANQLGWDLDLHTAYSLTSGLLSDTLGLTTENLDDNPQAITMLEQLVKIGVSLNKIATDRLEWQKISHETFLYKIKLLQRIEFWHDNRLVMLTIPHQEIQKYSLKYNPTIVLDEMRFVENVQVSIGLKLYEKNNKIVRITGRIRTSRGLPIAIEIAQIFGGSGHKMASGFKIEGTDLDYNQIKQQLIQQTYPLLRSL